VPINSRRLNDLHGLFDRNPKAARELVEKLFAGAKLTATPIEMDGRRRFLLQRFRRDWSLVGDRQ
jgi:hypothetical protein